MDPRIAKIKEIADDITKTEQHLAELGQARRNQVHQLRADGWSYREIADALGITRARAQQLSK